MASLRRGKTVPEDVPPGEHEQMGFVEAMVRSTRNQFKTLRQATEEKLGIKIDTTSPINPWLVRHSSWIIGRFRKRADGHSSYFKIAGHEYKDPIVAFGEKVSYKDNSPSSLANKARSPW